MIEGPNSVFAGPGVQEFRSLTLAPRAWNAAFRPSDLVCVNRCGSHKEGPGVVTTIQDLGFDCGLAFWILKLSFRLYACGIWVLLRLRLLSLGV